MKEKIPGHEAIIARLEHLVDELLHNDNVDKKICQSSITEHCMILQNMIIPDKEIELVVKRLSEIKAEFPDYNYDFENTIDILLGSTQAPLYVINPNKGR